MKLPSGFPIVRQSSLETSRCLFRFAELLLRGKKEPASPYAGRGHEFHRLHKLYVDWLVKSQQEYDFGFAEDLCLRPDIGQEAAALWRSWFPSEIFEPGAVYGTEVKLCLDSEFKPCPEGEHAFSGEFDRLEIRDTDAEIWDAKTHFQPFDPGDTIQAPMYAWLLKKTMPHIENIKFTLSFVRWHIVRSVEYNSSDIDRLEREVLMPMILRILTAYETNAWPATPCKSCAYCSLACPLLEEGITAAQLGRIEDPVKAAQELYVLDKRSARLKSQLEAWTVENGAIDIGEGISLGFQKRTTQEYRVGTAVALNDEHGFNSYRCLSVDNAEVKKVAKKYPRYQVELDKMKTDKSTVTFGFRSKQ